VGVVSLKDDALPTLGKTIRKARNTRNTTLRHLADVLEVSVPTVSEIELDRRIPSEKLLLRIASELDLDADALRALAGKLTDEELGYFKKNPTALKLLIAMMAAGFGEKETEKLVKQVEKKVTQTPG
jgi:transcriptional regulator with XRE-family HTH domain